MRIRFVAQGQVQGVGFRPFVFSLAREYSLTGFVRNSPRGVMIEVQGRDADLTDFSRDLAQRLPPLARLTGLEREECAVLQGESSFSIGQSSTGGNGHSVLVSPDVCICRDCLADIADPLNRRFHYPFTNCTNCGPRYSITRSVPYDRVTTSMSCFPMCPDCKAEYENPADRRFHAQPNACPICGPHVWLLAGRTDGTRLAHMDCGIPHGRMQTGYAINLTGDAALRALAGMLADGAIAAVKGVGGFHLACDAGNDQAVAALRLRKRRPHKPFAVMAAGPEDARRVAVLGPEEESLLLSPEHPVVICPSLPRTFGTRLSPLISPDTSGIGLMLPYTPLHQLLLEYFAEALRQKKEETGAERPAILVMTSGNLSGEPICLGNREALACLDGMADAFLFHNRDILIRVDDSVIRPVPGRSPIFSRRARGYAPRPVHQGNPDDSISLKGGSSVPPVILGVGAELKNTLCLFKGEDAFVSQHIGDVSTVETAAFHQDMRTHMSALLSVRAHAVVRDLHPGYVSGDLAEKLAGESGIPVLRLQHHFAHAHAVLAEHRHTDPALVLALDGSGFGEDGDVWGGEVLYLDSSDSRMPPVHKRLARFAPVALPGGEAAIREPWRIAHTLLLRLGLLRADASGTSYGLSPGASVAKNVRFPLPWLPEYAKSAGLLPRMLEKGVNTPWSTSCGRLFDAVSALLGLCNAVTYEGQAAIRLEESLQGSGVSVDDGEYPCPFAPATSATPSLRREAAEDCPDLLQLHTIKLFVAVYEDYLKGTPIPVIARRFHASLAAGLAKLAAYLGRRHGVRHVGLSGGCLQNVTLLLALVNALEKKGLLPLLHKDLPPGDGCISLGQAVWGRRILLASRKREEANCIQTTIP
ncbi:MAG: carbamoyltransferase HypF [Desulfovibrio sp.]|nr:carbamoyltransferase HypF [Desulfovibrio sp.]